MEGLNTDSTPADRDRWAKEPWRAPPLEDGEKLLIDLHGRVINKTCYRSYWLRLVRHEIYGLHLRIKHGGGVEKVKLGLLGERLYESLMLLDEVHQYALLFELYDQHNTTRKQTAEATAMRYKRAFVDGTLKRRKFPSTGQVKVWIEDGRELEGLIVKAEPA